MTFAEFEIFCRDHQVTVVNFDRARGGEWNVSGWQASPTGKYVRSRGGNLEDAVGSFAQRITSKLTITPESGQCAQTTDLTGIL